MMKTEAIGGIVLAIVLLTGLIALYGLVKGPGMAYRAPPASFCQEVQGNAYCNCVGGGTTGRATGGDIFRTCQTYCQQAGLGSAAC